MKSFPFTKVRSLEIVTISFSVLPEVWVFLLDISDEFENEYDDKRDTISSISTIPYYSQFHIIWPFHITRKFQISGQS